MGEYAGYVIAAYAITGAVIAARIALAIVERRAARKGLARAERMIARLSGPGRQAS